MERLLAVFFFFFVLIYKITLFFLLYRLFTSFFINTFVDINNLFIIGCLLSSIIGGIGACYEVSIQKFLVYTSLVQTSYIVGGFLTNSIESISSALLYILCYFIVFLGFYLSITFLLNKNFFFSDLPFLYSVSPFLGLLLIFYTFLLIGIPPSILFFGKFLLFLNIFFTGHYFMFFVFLFVSIFTAIYYLNIIVSMLQSTMKKNIIQNKNNLNKNNNEGYVFYDNFSIDTKEFYNSFLYNYDITNNNFKSNESLYFYKVSEFQKYIMYSYSYFCYFFWLILYLIFVIIISFYFLFFYKIILQITESLYSNTLETSYFSEIHKINNFFKPGGSLNTKEKFLKAIELIETFDLPTTTIKRYDPPAPITLTPRGDNPDAFIETCKIFKKRQAYYKDIVTSYEIRARISELLSKY